MSHEIHDVAALEAVLGKTPGPMHLKVIDHVDAGARQWIAAAPLAVLTFIADGRPSITLAGGRPACITARDEQCLVIPKSSLDNPSLARTGSGCGALFIAPGIGETLRVNGRVTAVDDGMIEVTVSECFIHCAKALIRSAFWSATPHNNSPGDAGEFLAASRFVALATCDSEGRADVSPKGDPQGAMIRLVDSAVWFADRPGNRRADGFRNILSQPQIAAVAFTPGCTRVAVLTGAARITTDDRLRTGFTVENKQPKLGTCIDEPRIEIIESAAVARAALWPVGEKPSINPVELMVAHVKANNQRGLQASLVRMALSVPKLLEKGLERDYKQGLY